MAKKFDVIGVGLNIIDLLFLSPENVVHDSKQFVKDLVMQGGAPIGSGISALGRMGYKSAFVAKMSKGVLSDISLGEFRNNNLAIDFVVTDKNSQPAIAIVAIDEKTSARTVYVSMNNYGYLKKKDIPVQAIKDARLLMVDSYDFDATEIALKAAKNTNCRTLVDFEYGDKERTLKLIGMATDIILPLECARRLTNKKKPEDTLKALSKYTKGQLIVTDGKNGSWALTDEGVIHQDIVKEKQAVDSTGCGDAFHAGYGIGILEGWDLKTRMECGAWLASIVITKLGGRTALPFKKDIPKLVGKNISKNLREKLLKIAKRK